MQYLKGNCNEEVDLFLSYEQHGGEIYFKHTQFDVCLWKKILLIFKKPLYIVKWNEPTRNKAIANS